MVILSKRLFFCFALHTFGAIQLTRSIPNPDGHIAKQFLGMFQGSRPTKTNEITTMDALTDSTEQGMLVQGMRLEETDVNKAEIQSMKTDRQHIKLRLGLLDPGGTPELIELKAQLENLHAALGTPTFEKVLQLNGRGSLMPSLQPASKTTAARASSDGGVAGSREAHPPSRFDFLNPSVQWRRLKIHLQKLGAFLKRIMSSKTARKSDTAESRQPLLGDHTLKPKSEYISNRKSLPKTKPIEPGQNGAMTGNSETLADAKGIQFERPEGELHGDVLDLVREHMLNEDIKIWHELKKTLVSFPSTPDLAGHDDGKIFRSGFLECLYLIEGFIRKYELLPLRLMGDTDLLERTTLLKMLEYHTELLLKRFNIRFFDIAESMIPQLEFLTTGRAVKHFHSSIEGKVLMFDFKKWPYQNGTQPATIRLISSLFSRYVIPPTPVMTNSNAALSDADQRHAVYLVLSVIMRHAPWHSRRVEENLQPSDRFGAIRTVFTHNDFLQKIQLLSTASGHTPHQDYLEQAHYLPVVHLVNDAIDFFQVPSLLGERDVDRLEFLVVFYMLDFLDQFYRPLVVAVLRNRSRPELLHKQLEFMRGELKFYRNRFEDPKYPDEKQDMAFLEMFKTSYHEDTRLHGWITTVTHKLMEKDLQHHEEKKVHDLTLWMGKECWNCRFPFRRCYEGCPYNGLPF
ncbi:hypothetical protein MJO28_000498 [Puccinia striiformis f. sp. tritici]|uniref:Uncharacterized protein n=1 Tax=Puccinia striiformis f. sp. tritici TaxID=168172 RepID=A0ACC0F051_9BASI|nr:hypothetical protein MJO28_000498 [Puccinia striiformis f. sp. tritici]